MKEPAADADAMRALFQGFLVGATYELLTRQPSPIVQPADVVQERDDAGNYLPWFSVRLASGIRLRVSVEVET